MAIGKLKLSRKFLLIATVSMLLVILLLAVVESNLNIHEAEKLAQKNLIAITQGALDSINIWLHEKRNQVSLISQSVSIRDLLRGRPNYAAKLLQDFYREFGSFENIVILDQHGLAVLDAMGRVAPGTDLSPHPFWTSRREEGIRLDPEIAVSTVSGNLIMRITAPVRDENGGPLGVVGFDVEWELFWNRYIGSIVVGKTGYVAVTDMRHRNIAHPDRSLHLRDLSGLPFIRRIVREKNGFQEYTFQGKKKYMAYKQCDEIDWIVDAAVDRDEMLEGPIFARNMIFLVGVICLVTFLFVIGYIDVFKLKKAEDTLSREEERLRLLIHHMPVMLIAFDEFGRIVAWNAECERVTGFSRREILNDEKALEFLYPDRDIRMRIIRQHLIQADDYRGWEIDVMAKDGGARTVSWYNISHQFPVQGWASWTIGFDITARKLAEMELKRHHDHLDELVRERTAELERANRMLKKEIFKKEKTKEALKESESRYRRLVEMSPDAVAINSDGKIIFINAAGARILGAASPEEVVGRHAADFVDPAAAQPSKLMLHNIPRRREAMAFAEEELRRVDQRTVQVELAAVPFTYHGKPAVLIVGRDITERKQAELQAKLHQQQLLQADKMIALGTLVAGVAHEINNPNNSIMLNAGVVSEIWNDIRPILEEFQAQTGDFLAGGMPSHMLQHYVDDLLSGILDSSKRIRNIVDDLKNFARPSESDMSQQVNLNDVVRSSIALLTNMIHKASGDFQVNYAADLPPVFGNFQRLEQVVINLMQNACQALTPAGGGIRVATVWDEKNNHVVLEVQDDGVGIAAEHLSRITDPFFTTKRDSGGTGLGLAVSSRIIKDHRGRMEFISKAGGGTTVIVRLPVGRSDPPFQGVIA